MPDTTADDTYRLAREQYLAHEQARAEQYAIRLAAAADADRAISLTMTMYESVDRITMMTNASRPLIRRELDQLSRDIDAMRDALKRSSVSWPRIRDDAITRLRVARGSFDPLFRRFR